MAKIRLANNAVKSNPKVKENKLFVKDLFDDIAALILQAANLNRVSKLRTNRRIRLVDKAVEFMNNADLKNLSLSDVTNNVYTSQRTLENAFKTCLDITPKRFLINMRLNAIRKDLLNAQGNQNVQSIVKDYGITHMGNFSKSYRTLFEETPKESLLLAA